MPSSQSPSILSHSSPQCTSGLLLLSDSNIVVPLPGHPQPLFCCFFQPHRDCILMAPSQVASAFFTFVHFAEPYNNLQRQLRGRTAELRVLMCKFIVVCEEHIEG
ncbi:hypothetical protein RYX36_032818 [Vicia faba]